MRGATRQMPRGTAKKSIPVVDKPAFESSNAQKAEVLGAVLDRGFAAPLICYRINA
jgi:hypothetical protein